MIGIRVLPCNYLWTGRAMMARRHIRINVSMTFFAMKIVKQVIQTTLFGNLNKKVIVYTNTTASLELLRSETESWMDLSDEIKEDVLVIQGDLQPEVKFVSAEQFTRVVDHPQQLIDTNQFYPRILLATDGCIGAGLDSADVYSVCRVGFPTSITNMVQEMGRCGRGRIENNRDGSDTITDNLYLKLTLDDYVYLNQRLYLPQPKNGPGVITILS